VSKYYDNLNFAAQPAQLCKTSTMSAAKQAAKLSARWRKKKLEEDAQQFRAKEASRIKNYRARQKERTAALRNATISSDDVDTWLNSVVEEVHHSSHVPSFRRSSRASSSTAAELTHGSRDSHTKDDDNFCHPCPSSTMKHQDALKIIANAQKTLQDWNTRWGTIANFSSRIFNTPDRADSTHGELMAMIRKGREMLLQLKSIAFVDLKSIRADDFPNFWIETFRAAEGIHERVAHADAALRNLDMESRT